ncbi:outer membrane beta-barrel protein, partial [Chitinophagales bacterium]|nr:outer membrane beta-barrel protein [Chitinophagales bacterium]
MKNLLVILCLCLTGSLSGQASSYSLTGTVVDARSQEAIDYATVIIKQLSDGALVSGTTTSDGGKFALESPTAEIRLEISFIGYSTLEITDLVFTSQRAELGIIQLGVDSKALDEVLISAEKSTTEFRLDKRVFNVGTDLSSSGAGALEVLNNVPSVNVNIEGEVSLRGATGVQILINGKPSILSDDPSNALGTITADMIDKIEVITNPSAKYEAEGTAGIINIILKKNEKKGLNGSISLNTGTPHNHSIGLSLNQRMEKFNLFTQLGAGYRELPRDSENTNEDRITGTSLFSEGIQYRNEYFYNFVLGSDYYINPQNIITLSGSFTYEVEDQPSETLFQLSNNNVLESEWTRNEMTEATNPKYQYELQYKRDFKDHKEHKLLFSAIGRFFGKDQSSYFSNTTNSGTNDQPDQQTATSFQEGKYTFNLDYTKPFSDKWTLEAGSQYLTNDVSNDFSVSNQLDGVFVKDPGLTNLFEYSQTVLGLYSTGSYENKAWGIKLGLRVEYTDLNTLLVTTNES